MWRRACRQSQCSRRVARNALRTRRSAGEAGLARNRRSLLQHELSAVFIAVVVAGCVALAGIARAPERRESLEVNGPGR